MLTFFLPTRYYLVVRNNGQWTICAKIKTRWQLGRALIQAQRFLHNWRIEDTQGNILYPDFS